MKCLLLFLVCICSSSLTAQDSADDQYNILLPTSTQRQPIYFTKDMTLEIGTTELGFYGFIKADFLSETRITGNTADVVLNTIPLNSDLADRKTQSLLDARSSRLGMKIEDKSGLNLMKGAIEGDFYTNTGSAIVSNSRTFRLRLAYASAETPSHFFFLAGQYYGLAMHYPEIDMPTRVNILHYPAGVVDNRQPQFRLGYKQYFSSTRLLQYEWNAETQGYNTTGIVTPQGGDTAQASLQKWPLFNAKISWITPSIKWQICFSGTRAYAITNLSGNRVNTPVWGVLSSCSYTWNDLIVWGTLHHLVGLSGFTSGYLDQLTLVNQNTQLKALPVNGGALALRYDFIKNHLWTDLMYGVERGIEIPHSIFTGTSYRRIEDFRVNLIGSFWKHWQIGLEYERTAVQAYNGLSGLDQMIHLAVWYIFGQP